MLPNVTIHPYTLESVGHEIQGLGGTLYASLVSNNWPLANLAIYVPFCLSEEITVTHLWTANGTGVAGNIDIGIYSQGGARLCSTGSTAQSGTSTVQAIALGTPYLLGAGEFYLALAASSTSALFLSGTPVTSNRGKIAGFAEQTSALPLPQPATFAAYTRTYIPLFGLSTRAI